MEADARYTWVGAGVLLLVGALLAGVLWLKNVGSKSDYNRFAVHFEHQALDGLEIGAEVTLRGIRVGRVEDYALSGDKLNRVRVQLRVDRRAPVRTNTVAVVTRNFVTGIAAITLINHEPAGPPLTEVPEGEDYPLIGEGRSDLEEIAGRVNKVGDMAAVALNNINQLFTADSRETLLATARSLGDLAKGIDGRLASLDASVAVALRKVGKAADAMGGAAEQMGRAGDRVAGGAERVAGAAERGIERLDRTLAETERSLGEARRTLTQLVAATQALQQQAQATARRMEDSLGHVDDQLGAALAELRLSAESAARVLDRLRDPRAALLGPGKAQLGPGEKLP